MADDTAGGDDLFSKRLLVVSGKGGVGKTVITSAMALIASARGMNVLLIKMDDQGRTAQLFESEQPVGDVVTPLRESISAINLDPITVVADYFTKQLRVCSRPAAACNTPKLTAPQRVRRGGVRSRSK